MRLGIISEGTTEQAVIINILAGLGIDSSDTICIRPDLNLDETDIHNNQQTIGTWQGVKNACTDLIEIEKFLSIDGNEFVIIQIDTAECGEPDFNVTRPNKKSGNYGSELRELVIQKISSWMSNKNQSNIIYAVCVEEIEAWILTLFNSASDTCIYADPKARLQRAFNAANINTKFTSSNYEFYFRETKLFQKRNKLNSFVAKNISLQLFVEDIRTRVLPLYQRDL